MVSCVCRGFGQVTQFLAQEIRGLRRDTSYAEYFRMEPKWCKTQSRPELHMVITVRQGPYSGCDFPVHLKLSARYPFTPPVLCFKREIRHPYFREVNGQYVFACNSWQQVSDWSPGMGLATATMQLVVRVLAPS